MTMQQFKAQPETIKVLVIYPGPRPSEFISFPSNNTGNELRTLVGGWIELVRPKYFPMRKQLDWSPVMVVNEDGVAKHLEYNRIASDVYLPGGSTFIYGTAVIMQEALFEVEEEEYAEPDLTGLPDDWALDNNFWGINKSDEAKD